MSDTATIGLQVDEQSLAVFRAQQALDAARAELIKIAEKLRHQVVRAIRNELYWLYADARIQSRDPAREGSKWTDERGFDSVWPNDRPLVGLVARYEITAHGTIELIIIVPGDRYEYKINAERHLIEILDEFPVSN